MKNLANKSRHGISSKISLPNCGSRTDVGCVRDHNEDSLIVEHPLYAVFDGMGGHAAGEVASEIACKVISNRAPKSLDVAALGQAVEEANLSILEAAKEGVGKKGMGTTCTACMLEGEKLNIAQVGDSRAYLLHDGRLNQLTRDHSYVQQLVETGQITKEEARVHPNRSMITRALGSDPRMIPDLYEISVSSGDRLLICTDGLYSMVSDSRIEEILCSVEDAQECADLLVSAANNAGGNDNITVIVVDVSGFTEIKKKKLARKTKITATVIVLALLAIIFGAIFGFNAWLNNTSYLSVDGDKVAIFKGMPGQILGNQTNWKVETTDVSISDLEPGVQARIKNNEVKCASVDDARKLVSDYKKQISDNRVAADKLKENSASKTEGSSSENASPSSSQNQGSNQ